MKPRRTLPTGILVALLTVALLSGTLAPLPVWCDWPDVFYTPRILTERERAALRSVGVADIRYDPAVDFATFARGKGAGAAKGAAGGFASAAGSMGHCGGDFCGLAFLLWLATAGVVAAVHGAITGALDALPADEAERIEEAARALFARLRLQERIREAVMQAGQRKTSRKFVFLDGRGPSAPGDKVDYRPAQKEGLDAVLEICADEIAFSTPPQGEKFDRKDPPLFLFLDVSARLVRLSDGKVLYDARALSTSEGPLKRAKWEAEGYKAFFEALSRGYGDIAEKVIDDLFVTYIPEQAAE